ncbi:MAG: MFS transporter [Candidatus Lokiarchaeota archaeon]|nr:MFS transporter [Candidatus Lokiarchaeota archaeon]MBD3341859.1 MFS transporter [Candidatus Lokiarchaeota archaeon]
MENGENNHHSSEENLKPFNHQEHLKKYEINKKKAMITIMLCIFIDVLGYSMILPLMPSIVLEAFDGSNFTIGILIATNAMSALIFAPIWGKLSDHYGRKPFLIVSQMGTLAAFLLLGFSTTLEMVFYSRILDGIFGGQIPIIRAYVIDITEKKSRSSEMGKFSGVIAVGIIFGPAIGGLLGFINWRYPLFIASLLSLITILFTLSFIKESMPRQRVLDIKKRKEDNRERNINQKPVIFQKQVAIRLLQAFLLIFVFVMINTSFPLVTYLRYGFNVAMIGLFASLFGILAMITGGFLVKPMVKKWGEKLMLSFSIILAIVVFMAYPFLYTTWSLFIFIVPYVVCHILTRAIIISNLTNSVDEDQQGTVSGWTTNMQAIAQILAPIIAYSYLEIWMINFLGISFDAYFMIGLTCVFTTLVLLALVVYDMKLHPEIFTHEIEI